jgi:hypothetical protein
MYEECWIHKILSELSVVHTRGRLASLALAHLAPLALLKFGYTHMLQCQPMVIVRVIGIGILDVNASRNIRALLMESVEGKARPAAMCRGSQYDAKTGRLLS